MPEALFPLDLFPDDVIRVLQQPDSFRRDLSDDPDGQARPGKRLPVDDIVRHAQSLSDHAYLVLEEFAERLDQPKLHSLRQAAHVMVALDSGRRPFERDAFYDIGVKGTLREVRCVAHAPGLLFEDLDEKSAYDFSLLLRVLDPGQRLKKFLSGVHMFDIQVESVFEYLEYFSRFILAQHAVIDEHARQPLPDGPVHQRGNYG